MTLGRSLSTQGTASSVKRELDQLTSTGCFNSATWPVAPVAGGREGLGRCRAGEGRPVGGVQRLRGTSNPEGLFRQGAQSCRSGTGPLPPGWQDWGGVGAAPARLPGGPGLGALRGPGFLPAGGLGTRHPRRVSPPGPPRPA